MTFTEFLWTAAIQITMASIGAVIGTTLYIRVKFGEWWWK